MARVNVYLPDELADEARAASLNVSGLAQDAVREALASRRMAEWIDGLAELRPTGVTHAVVAEAVADAKDEFERG